jgi:hypothetical protein
MGASIARILDLIPTSARQIIPLNGIFGEGWQASTAIALYWFESLLLMLVAAALCWRLRRRTSDDAIAAVQASGDDDGAAALLAEQQAAKRGGVNPTDVLVFYGGSLGVFGGFLGGVLLILTANGHLPPFDWLALRDGAKWMTLAVAGGFGVEMLMFPAMSVAAVKSRVDACMGRWALLWLLGFVGTILLGATGRASAFLGWFAILKAVWEGWGMLARLFGWKSADERAEQAQAQASGLPSQLSQPSRPSRRSRLPD